MNARVVALIATYRRPRELARLLASLEEVRPTLELVVVVDNAGCAETQAVGAAARCRCQVIVPGQNLGCGGGLLRAGEEAWRLAGEQATHVLILDDDSVLEPETLAALLAALKEENAEAACPLVLSPEGTLGWLPGLATRRAERAAESVTTPETFRSLLGAAPQRFHWTQGICLLITRRAIEACGWHRDDFWVRGEDLEFSLRLTARFPGVLVPRAVAQHLPPPAVTKASQAAEYLRHAAMLQNVAYIGLRLPHGRRIAWTLPSNLLRFVRQWGFSSIVDAARAFWRGAIAAEPAGAGRGRTFLARFRALP